MVRYGLMAVALTALPSWADEPPRNEVDRFQALATSLPDGSPGLWVLDTAFGRVAFCSYQKVLEQGGTTSNGVEWSLSEVSCSAFAVTQKGPWDRYQQE